jgi:endonuclease-8
MAQAGLAGGTRARGAGRRRRLLDAPVVEISRPAPRPSTRPREPRPDLLDDDFDEAERIAGSAPRRAATSIGEVSTSARRDRQRLSGGVLFERVDPFAPVRSLDDETLDRLVATARQLLRVNADRRRGPERTTTGNDPAARGAALWVYGRAGRPCRRCGTTIRSTTVGRDLPRTVWWCPACQASSGATAIVG